MPLVCSILPFPPITWWAHVINASSVILDRAEHFEKMSYRNRYRVSGANNAILLSIPLVKGRNQRIPMHEVQISDHENWQVQHWRALTSTYKRTPYWDYYEPGLQEIFDRRDEHLITFNNATIEWVLQQLRVKKDIQYADVFVKHYADDAVDIRGMKPANEQYGETGFPHYYQVFEDRVGFIPNLSILDLLCSEGPQATEWLKSNFARLTDSGKLR